jgi:hypothetical protein
MKHECGLCLRDNSVCAIGKSFWELLRGKVVDCSIYEDYHKGLIKEKKICNNCIANCNKRGYTSYCVMPNNYLIKRKKVKLIAV